MIAISNLGNGQLHREVSLNITQEMRDLDMMRETNVNPKMQIQSKISNQGIQYNEELQETIQAKA